MKGGIGKAEKVKGSEEVKGSAGKAEEQHTWTVAKLKNKTLKRGSAVRLNSKEEQSNRVMGRERRVGFKRRAGFKRWAGFKRRAEFKRMPAQSTLLAGCEGGGSDERVRQSAEWGSI